MEVGGRVGIGKSWRPMRREEEEEAEGKKFVWEVLVVIEGREKRVMMGWKGRPREKMISRGRRVLLSTSLEAPNVELPSIMS